MKDVPKRFVGFCLALVLFLSCWLGAVSASPTLVDPRINRLESQVRSLQSQVNRLQGQVSRPSSHTAPNSSSPPSEEPSLDQQFDTLAILIIELQERVSALEARLETTP